MKFVLLGLILIALSACHGHTGRMGPKGDKGDTGTPGSSCSVSQAVNGAIITCTDGTMAVILNGVDGTDGADGTDGVSPSSPYLVTEIIDPCGDDPGEFDEVLLRLSNGQLIAHFSHGNLQFLTVLTSGSYQTTDKQKCNFSVDSDGIVHD